MVAREWRLPDRQAIQLQVVYDAGNPPPSLTLAARLFPYDPVHQTFVNVYERDAVVLQAILDGIASRSSSIRARGRERWRS